jgi:uracil-DNA glycosylase
MALTSGDVAATDWNPVLRSELDAPYWRELQAVRRCRAGAAPGVPTGTTRCSRRCTSRRYAKVKAVILGQDPYHGPGQAHGLCFSVPAGVEVPPSLRNIYLERHTDLGLPPPAHGNLEAWARQGVLLLNATLTVGAGAAGSHQGKGWETFTDAVISTVARREEPAVFILWGATARRKKALIDWWWRSAHRHRERPPLALVGQQRLLRQPPVLAHQRGTGEGRS